MIKFGKSDLRLRKFNSEKFDSGLALLEIKIEEATEELTPGNSGANEIILAFETVFDSMFDQFMSEEPKDDSTPEKEKEKLKRMIFNNTLKDVVVEAQRKNLAQDLINLNHFKQQANINNNGISI